MLFNFPKNIDTKLCRKYSATKLPVTKQQGFYMENFKPWLDLGQFMSLRMTQNILVHRRILYHMRNNTYHTCLCTVNLHKSLKKICILNIYELENLIF